MHTNLKILLLAALASTLALSLSGCGKDEEPDPYARVGVNLSADALHGTWVDASNNLLTLDGETGSYTYRTWYGRIGSGTLYAYEDGPMLSYGDFQYSMRTEDEGESFLLYQNGTSSTDFENIDGQHFSKTDAAIPDIPLSTLNGMWQNAQGELLVIDTDRMLYLLISSDAMASGTMNDAGDGRGVYLAFNNGHAHPTVLADGSAMTLHPLQTGIIAAEMGEFSGVFYRDADFSHTNLSQASFVELDGHTWYYDGLNYFALPEGYTVAEDGRAYDEDGKLYAAGWTSELYDPSADWGENWLDNMN